MCNIFHVYVNYANVLKGLQFPTPTLYRYTIQAVEFRYSLAFKITIKNTLFLLIVPIDLSQHLDYLKCNRYFGADKHYEIKRTLGSEGIIIIIIIRKIF